MQHMTNITNLSDVIPTTDSIPCPDGAIVLQYHLILIHTLLLAWMIVYIMANARTLHAKIVLERRRYSSYVLHVWPPIIIDLLMVQLTVCKKASRQPPNTQNHKNI